MTPYGVLIIFNEVARLKDRLDLFQCAAKIQWGSALLQKVKKISDFCNDHEMIWNVVWQGLNLIGKLLLADLLHLK